MCPFALFQHGTECYVCGKKFQYLHTLLIHVRGQHTNEPKLTKRAACRFCDRDFAGYLMLNKHHFFAHREEYLKEKPCWCKVCYRIFHTPEEVSSHLKVHDRFKCPVCEHYSSSQVVHDLHLRHHNLGPRAAGTSIIRNRNKPTWAQKNSEFYEFTKAEKEREREMRRRAAEEAEHNQDQEQKQINVSEMGFPPNQSQEQDQEVYKYVPNSDADADPPLDLLQSWNSASTSDEPSSSFTIRILGGDAEYQHSEAEPSSLAGGPLEPLGLGLQSEVQGTAEATETSAPSLPDPVPKEYICDKCPRQFVYPKHLILHLNWHVSPRCHRLI